MDFFRFPQNAAEVRENRIRFLTELRNPDNCTREMKGGLFRDLYRDGKLVKVECCAVGLAADIFLGIHSEGEYQQAAENKRVIYSEVNMMLGEPEQPWFIDGINDFAPEDPSIFRYVADQLAKRWGL